eukprot:1160714-Pelagomonas_calceolata.AAC.23
MYLRSVVHSHQGIGGNFMGMIPKRQSGMKRKLLMYKTTPDSELCCKAVVDGLPRRKIAL